MGRKVLCHAALGSERGEVTAMLEGTGILIRGEFKADLSTDGMRGLKADGGSLVASTEFGPLMIELGAAEAAKWVEKLLNPPSLAKKLGLAEGTPVYVDGKHAVVLEEVEAAAAKQVPVRDAQLLFLVVESPSGIERLGALARARAAGSHLWVLRRKGKAAPVAESQIMQAARNLGLSPTKTAAWSAEWAADRYSTSAGS